jgi:ribonuclease HI
MADLLNPVIYTDSAVVANQINGKWKCRNDSLLPLLMTVEDIRDEFNFKVVQVERSFVWEPDALANEFLDTLEKRKTPKTKDDVI